MRNRIIIILSLVFLLCHMNVAYSTVSPVVLNWSNSAVRNIDIRSYDFSIEIFECEGTVFDSITTINQNKDGLFSSSSNGGKLLLTPNSVFLDVISGSISMNLMAYDGTLVTLAADAGNRFEFEPDSFTITASATNANTVSVSIDGIKFLINPGENTRFVDINILPVSESYSFSQKENSLISVAILGSTYLDVSKIELSSLFIEMFGEKIMGKGNIPPTIKHTNDDGYLDLVVKIETDNNFLQSGISYAILKGILSDGTTINGKANVRIIP